MAWRSSRNVDRSNGPHYFPGGQHYIPANKPGQQWLFIHVTWRALDQSRSRISDRDITMLDVIHEHNLLPLLTESRCGHVPPRGCCNVITAYWCRYYGESCKQIDIITVPYLFHTWVIICVTRSWPYNPVPTCILHCLYTCMSPCVRINDDDGDHDDDTYTFVE